MDLLPTGGAGCVTGAHCPGQTDDEYATEFALWALTQSPLIVATDLRNLTSRMRALMLNVELLAIHQNTSSPPGRLLSEWLCSEPLKCVVWGRALTHEGDEWLLALVNYGERPHTISATWGTLNWPRAARATVRDVWAQSALPDASGSVSARVASHATALLRVRLHGDSGRTAHGTATR